MKVKSESEVTQSYPTPGDPMDCSPAGSSVHGIFQARILEWVTLSYSRDLPNAGIQPTSLVSPALQADSLPAEPQGKPKNTGVGTLFLLILMYQYR